MVSVLRDGRHIKNSPFRIEVRQSEIGDPSKVRIYGQGLSEGIANQLNEFYVNTKEAGKFFCFFYLFFSLAKSSTKNSKIICKSNTIMLPLSFQLVNII